MLRKFEIINFQYNAWNGLIFTFFSLEIFDFEGDLFSFQISNEQIYFEILSIKFIIKSPFL